MKGNSDPNRFKNAIIEKTRQAMDSTSRKSTSTSLDKVRPNNQVGHRVQQTQSRSPPKFKQDPNLKETYSIFDKWVEFRDKYLAGNVNDGARKVGYTGKFMFNSLLNSNFASNLKQKAVDEASNLKNKVTFGQIFSSKSSSDKQDFTENITDKGSWKDSAKEKFGYGAEFAKEKFGQGAEFAKGKAQEAFVYGKEVGAEKLGQGAEIAKEKFGQGAEIAKEKLGQGAEVAKEKLGKGAEFAKGKAQEAYTYGQGTGKEHLYKGAEFAKEKLGQGAEIAKEKLGQGAEIAKEKAQEAFVYGKGAGKEQLYKGAEFAKEKLGQGAEVAKEKLGQGAQVLKDKVQDEYSQRKENISNYSKESFKSATKGVSDAASNAYDSVKSAPEMVTNKMWKYFRRAGVMVFMGATVVAFAYAAGRQLPIAYFNYQLKKQNMEGESNRPEEKIVRNERNVD